VALETVLSMLPELESIARIRFVLFADSDRALYKRELDARLGA
jgi:hypothetical protein